MKGVTLATYRRYRPDATKADLRNISDAELKQIYRDGYWDKVRGDHLPSGVDMATFDFAVNSGPSRAVIFLQRVLGVDDDGLIGPVTLKAAGNVDPVAIITGLCDARLNWLRGLSTFSTFGNGWTKRVRGVKKLAIEMAVAFQTPTEILFPKQPDDPGPAPETPVEAVPAPPDSFPMPPKKNAPAVKSGARVTLGGVVFALIFIAVVAFILVRSFL